jgi:hypothetical protein
MHHLAFDLERSCLRPPVYAVRVTNAAGAVASAPARVELDPPAARLVNFSCRNALVPGLLVIPSFTLSQSSGGARFDNISVRSVAAAEDSALILGFVKR